MLLNESSLIKLKASSGGSGGDFIFCKGCGLKNGCQTPAMKGTGEGKRGVLFIAEAPGKTEDASGIQLIGKAGRFLRETLRSMDFDLDRDARKINAVNCRPPRNRTPTMKEIRSCRPMVLSEILSFRPRVIVLLGDVAVKSYYLDRLSHQADLKSMRGWAVPDTENGCWVVATYHPSYLLRMSDNGGTAARSGAYRVLFREFKNHLKKALSLTETPVPKDTLQDYEKRVVVLEKEDLEEAFLETYRRAKAGKENILAFDYETTGIKPFRPEHAVAYCSFCTSENRAFAFVYPNDKKLQALWRELLTNKSIYKIAHNAKFEDLWTRKVLGFQVTPWLGDTMLLSHFLDNRGGINSLKFQTAVRLGVFGYENEVSAYLQPSKEERDRHGTLAVNRIQQAPSKKGLVYCALDSLFTFKLFHIYLKEVQEQFGLSLL